MLYTLVGPYWYLILAMYKLTCGFSLIQPDLYQLTFLCVGRSAEFCASQLHLEQIQWLLKFDTLAYKTKVFCLNTSHILAPPLPYCPEQAPIGACNSSAKKKVSGRLHGEGSWMVQLSPCKGPPRIRESEQQRVLQNRGNYTKTWMFGVLKISQNFYIAINNNWMMSHYLV